MRESSCINICIKIKLDWGDEKVSVKILYLQVIIKVLYVDMIKPPGLGGFDESKDNDRNFIISDSKLCGFFHHKCN